MNTVARIGPVALEPDQELINICAELLELAKTGELGGIAYIGYLADRNVKYGFVGPEMAGQTMRTYGLLHWLAGRAMQRWQDSNEP